MATASVIVGPWTTTFAPSSRTAATLASGALSGTTMVAVAPCRRAAYAMD
jgi:hypothetical protein